jgi:hypothetical protein
MQVIPCLRQSLEAEGSTNNDEEEWHSEKRWVSSQDIVERLRMEGFGWKDWHI